MTMSGWALWIVCAFALYGSWTVLHELWVLGAQVRYGYKRAMDARRDGKPVWCRRCGFPQVETPTRCCAHGTTVFCYACGLLCKDAVPVGSIVEAQA